MNNKSTLLANVIVEWDEFHWSGHIPDLGSLGREIEIHVETREQEEMPPHPLQVDLWERILAETDYYAELVRAGLFEYYRAIRPQYEKAGPEWAANMPVLTEKEAIDDMLSLNYIAIRWPDDGDTPGVGFSYSCQWDEEHGAGIVIKGSEVLNIGGADCLYYG